MIVFVSHVRVPSSGGKGFLMPRAKKLKSDFDGFEVTIDSGDLNAHCKKCGAIATFRYRGLDPLFPNFDIICNQCGTYRPMKIRMLPEFLTPEPYRGRRLFERWRIKHGRF